jgi:hypothetical protein
VRLEPICADALAACSLWPAESLYPWTDVAQWKLKDAKGFDLALWYGRELCGMCYATPRQSKINVKMILLQGKSREAHPLKGWVAPLALVAIDFYARMLGC